MSVRRAKPLVQVDSLEEHASQDLSPEGAFEASEESQRAFAAFQRLDDRQQQVIMLVDVEGVPASEAAAAMFWPTMMMDNSTVHVNLFETVSSLI